MKKELIRILLIFLVIAGAVFYGLNYLFLNGNSIKSRATGETMNLSFNPTSVTVTANQDFTVTLMAKPSINTVLRGYETRINFDKDKLRFKSIEYKLGVVSADLGATTADAAAINNAALGQINIMGEIQTPADGSLLTSVNGAEIATVTFTALSTTGTSVTMSDSGFYSVNSDMSLFNGWIVAARNLDINGGTTPTPTDIGANGIKLNLKLKFQGISKKPQNGLDKIGVNVTLVKGNNKQKINMMFVANDDGTWSPNTPMVFDKITSGSDYYILVKGGKHLQKKICQNDPNETFPGTYHCDQGKITLKAGGNDLDFSKIVLLAGDLPEQDGIVNSYDTSLVRNNLGKKDADSIRLADINLDGIVDTQDYSLIISALSIRSDEGDTEVVPTNVPTTGPTATVGPTSVGATATVAPTNPAATVTQAPTITGQGATGDLLRDGSTYPVYTSVSFIGCTGVTGSSVSSVVPTLLGQTNTYTNVPLTYQVTKPLLVGNTININDFLAQDLHTNDQEAHFGTTANIGVQATGISNYSSNLSSASFYSMSWCASPQGCQGVYESDLQGKKFIYIQNLRVCGY